MQSPLFALRERQIKRLFAESSLARTWRKKIRDAMKQQIIMDPVEHLDFHTKLNDKCKTLQQQISSGIYSPGVSRRILVEKSNGICRQIVVPNVNDALVLQRLSDALYQDIRGKEPTNRAFFEPDDHAFSRKKGVPFSRPEYGSFRAWLSFQKEVFQFTRVHKYVVITDIANYYDGISYSHLRNILSSTIRVRESVLDMLLYTLAGLLWQPDYMPHIEVGLPQINLDAPRILAHCFLYELDKFVVSTLSADYVRFMDDIDIGTGSRQHARRILRSIDLVLHTRQIRLNTGKTMILTNEEAVRHFCVRENRLLDTLSARTDDAIRKRTPIDPSKRKIRWLLSRWNVGGRFDRGNGQKVLKRLLTMAHKLDIPVEDTILRQSVLDRPSCREVSLRNISRQPIGPSRQVIMLDLLREGLVCDDASLLQLAYCVVDAPVADPVASRRFARELTRLMKGRAFSTMYAKLWIGSRFGVPSALFGYVSRSYQTWRPDPWLGRLVGGLFPIFLRTKYYAKYVRLVSESMNSDANDVVYFHRDLQVSGDVFPQVRSILMARNPSRALGVSHSKMLTILSALGSSVVAEGEKKKLISAHLPTWKDPIYRARARAAVQPVRLRPLIR